MKHIRKIIRESLKSKLNESVTITPSNEEYPNAEPDMDTLLDLAHLVKDTVAQLYYKYEFFKDLVDEGDYKIYHIVFFGEGYDDRFSFDDPTGPVLDQDIDNLPGDAKEWVIKHVKKRLNGLGFKYTIVPASELHPKETGIVWMISENPNQGKSRPQINLSNTNYSYIFHQLFELTDEYGGHMTASDVQDVALQLIAASNEFSRGDKVCMVVGKNKVCASSSEDAKYLRRVGNSLLEFAQECITQNFNKLAAS